MHSGATTFLLMTLNITVKLERSVEYFYCFAKQHIGNCYAECHFDDNRGTYTFTRSFSRIIISTRRKKKCRRSFTHFFSQKIIMFQGFFLQSKRGKNTCPLYELFFGASSFISFTFPVPDSGVK